MGSQKVAIIGAGLAGLAAIKEFEEAGHEVICFEKNADIGGVFSDLGTYDSVELTVSNYFMAYSDFMPYDDIVRFWSRKEYKDYLDRYAEHFNLRANINFECEVVAIKRYESHIEVSYKDKALVDRKVFVDAVSICSGQFQKPNMPNIEGLASFPGPVIHSSEYKNADACSELKGKNVLCLGMGESAADVVTEIAEIAGSTVLSLRRYHVFAPKNIAEGVPIDVMQSRSWHSLPAKAKADSVRNAWKRVAESPSDTANRMLAEHIVAASDEPGSVVTKTERIFEAAAKGMDINIGGISHIEGNCVHFNDGSKKNFDGIVLCTGFKFHLPFVNDVYRPKNIRDCYLQIFHPSLREKIFFIGFSRPQQGGVPLIAELQSRYVALVLSGERKLPADLETPAQRDRRFWEQEFYETPHIFGLINAFRYNEVIAELIGCRPPMPNLLFSPNKFFVYWFHHIWPCQFRLRGPGARKEARKRWHLSPCLVANNQNPSARFKAIRIYWLIKSIVRDKFMTNQAGRRRPIMFRRAHG